MRLFFCFVFYNSHERIKVAGFLRNFSLSDRLKRGIISHLYSRILTAAFHKTNENFKIKDRCATSTLTPTKVTFMRF